VGCVTLGEYSVVDSVIDDCIMVTPTGGGGATVLLIDGNTNKNVKESLNENSTDCQLCEWFTPGEL